MNSTAKRQLERLRDGLTDLADSCAKSFGYGVIVAKPTGNLPHASGWRFLEGWIAEHRRGAEIVRLEQHPWFDPAPRGDFCLRWWGDRAGADLFQRWLDRLGAILRRYPELGPAEELGKGYHAAALALAEIGSAAGAESIPVFRHSLLDLGQLRSRPDGIPKSLYALEPRPEFEFIEILGPAARASGRVIDKLRGVHDSQPRLAVDVQAGSVTIDGRTQWPDPVWVAILDLLLKTRTNAITRRMMREASPLLKEEERLDRLIVNIGKTLKIPIQGSRRGYRLPDEYLPVE